MTLPHHLMEHLQYNMQYGNINFIHLLLTLTQYKFQKYIINIQSFVLPRHEIKK